MRDINIFIKKDHTVDFENGYAGLNKENLQGNIVFNFEEFVPGAARIEVIIDDEKGYIELERVGQTYTLPIKSSLLKGSDIVMQLVITQEAIDEEIPIWKSESFLLKVGYSINATTTIPDEYPSWIDILETMASEVAEAIGKASNVNISSEQLTNGVKVITTNQDGEQTITIVPQGPQGEPGVPGAVKFIIVNELPTEDIQTDTIYLVPSDDPTTQDIYLEYMYINNQWELLGQKQIVVDLTDYVKKTDYATSSVGGVFKSGNSISVNSNGVIQVGTNSYADYLTKANTIAIGKGTLENVITGKGLVSNTNYATGQTGGVVKSNNYFNALVSNEGLMYSVVNTYADYGTKDDKSFISKGTLENVITGKGLTTKSYVDGLVGDISSVLDAINGEVI